MQARRALLYNTGAYKPLTALGDLAKEVSRALGGNGHRPDEIRKLMQELGAR